MTGPASTVTHHLEQEGRFYDVSTRDLVGHVVDVMREGDVILGDGDLDYAAADMLEVLAVMHDQTGIQLELLPQVRAFAITVLDGCGWEA